MDKFQSRILKIEKIKLYDKVGKEITADLYRVPEIYMLCMNRLLLHKTRSYKQRKAVENLGENCEKLLVRTVVGRYREKYNPTT